MNTREKVLKEALNCVNGEREKQYGNPEDSFQRIADFWGLYLTTLFEGTNVVIELDPIDVAKMMVLFKIARSLGDEDKLDNYVDIIGYAACGAEIFEKGDKVKKEIDAKLDEANDSYQYFMEKNFGKNPYSWHHDKLAEYVSIKAKEKHIQLDGLKAINHKFPRELEELLDREATDCVINGKKLFDCYVEIDELFDKYDLPDKSEGKDIVDTIRMESFTGGRNPYSYWKAYSKIATYIYCRSKETNVSKFDILDRLELNDFTPTTMAALLMTGKLSFDDAAAIIDNAIVELNTFYDDKLRRSCRLEDIKHLKESK